MTAITMSQTAHLRTPSPLPWLVAGLLLAVGAVVGTALSHATERHGTDAQSVRDCIEQQGYMQVWWNADNEHRIEVCQVDEHTWGLRVLKRISGKWQEITAFVRHQATTIEEVDQYLTNSGANMTWTR